MIKNYLKIAFRNLWKYKVFTGINLVGLSLAIGVSLLLFMTAFRQLSFDRFHEDGERIYRVYFEEYRASGTERSAVMPAPLTPALREEVPGISQAVRWGGGPAAVMRDGQAMDLAIRYADPGFFEVFSFPLLRGNPGQVLNDLNGVVLSENYAKRIFGDKDPLGQPLEVALGGKSLNLVVTGLVADFPENSSIKYGMITRFENTPGYKSNKEEWDNRFHHVFVKAGPQVSWDQVEDQMATVVHKYLSEDIEQLKRDGAVPDAEGEVMRLRLQPLHDLHFDRTVQKDGISRAFLIGLIIIAGFILAIAAINFVNLTLGGALRRAREVGVRKVMGATRTQLVGQFWGEALLLVGMSLVIGLALTQWMLPSFNSTFHQSIELAHPHLVLALAGILLIIGLSGGGYPALVLSRFQAAEVLKGNTQLQRPGRLRNMLMLIQFTFSVLLIACTIIVTQQIHYLRNKSLGFNKDQVVSIPIGHELDHRKTIDRLRNELSAYPEIRSISGTYRNLGMGKDGSLNTSIISFTQEEREWHTFWVPIDYDYLETLEIPLVEGRSFRRGRAVDSTSSIIINETFARQLGGGEPVIGKVLETNPKREVIGVVKDFHFLSLAEPITPLSLVISNNFRLNYILVRVAPENIANTMALLERNWKKINPQSEFQGSFLDENNERLYQAEVAMGKIFTSAALLTIVMSCMGLFGIALLAIGQRTKEIGIRKVMGASVRQIVALVSRDFVNIILTGIVLATPLAWWGMRAWLDNYAYRIDIHWWVFLLAGALALFIAFATMSWQSVRAARANPVEALRDE